LNIRFIGLLLFCACNTNSNHTSAIKDTARLEIDTTAQKDVEQQAYFEKDLHPAMYTINDTLKLVWFEDVVQDNHCSLYLKSVIEVVDSVRKPADFENISRLPQQAVLIVNSTSIELTSKVTDGELMLPTLIGMFSYAAREFIVIKMNLVSNIYGDYWYNLLLELDSSGHVISQTGVETTGMVSFDALKDHIDEQ